MPMLLGMSCAPWGWCCAELGVGLDDDPDRPLPSQDIMCDSVLESDSGSAMVSRKTETSSKDLVMFSIVSTQVGMFF